MTAAPMGWGSRWVGERGRVGDDDVRGIRGPQGPRNHNGVTGITGMDLWTQRRRNHWAATRFPTIHRPNYYSHWLNNEHGSSSGESESG